MKPQIMVKSVTENMYVDCEILFSNKLLVSKTQGRDYASRLAWIENGLVAQRDKDVH